MVKPKKHLGQHFLKDETIAQQITEAVVLHNGYTDLLEIGPGTGVLTQYLREDERFNLYLAEIDTESVEYLKNVLKFDESRILHGDFLRMDMKKHFEGPYGIIGNFPYNISSQIFFRVLDYRDQVQEVVCMLQKEVAKRLCSEKGNKVYGILSVLLQAYYEVEYLFTVDEHVFNPPPKVKSGVIRLRRNNVAKLPCDEKLFKTVVKQGFNNRRKTLRNALKPLNLSESVRSNEVLNLRAEQLSVDEFVNLVTLISSSTD